MALNLIGVFDDPSVAEQACRQIQALGIEEHHVRAHSNATGDGREHRGLLSRMFGRHGDKASGDLGGHYAEAVRRGASVVSVHLEHEDKASQVEAILEQAGAIDVNDRVQAWQSSGYTGHDLDTPDYTPDQVVQERASLTGLQGDRREGGMQEGSRVHRHGIDTSMGTQMGGDNDLGIGQRSQGIDGGIDLDRPGMGPSGLSDRDASSMRQDRTL